MVRIKSHDLQIIPKELKSPVFLEISDLLSVCPGLVNIANPCPLGKFLGVYNHFHQN